MRSQMHWRLANVYRLSMSGSVLTAPLHSKAYELNQMPNIRVRPAFPLEGLRLPDAQLGQTSSVGRSCEDRRATRVATLVVNMLGESTEFATGRLTAVSRTPPPASKPRRR